MYKTLELIQSGKVDESVLTADQQETIGLIRELSDNGTTDDEQAAELDSLLYNELPVTDVAPEATAETEQPAVPEASEEITPEEITTELEQPSATPDADPMNMFFNNAWFDQHPEKILGTQEISKDRYGKEITTLSGTVKELDKIDVPELPERNAAATTKSETAQAISEKPESKGISDEAIEQSEKSITKKTIRKTQTKAKQMAEELPTQPETAELQSFREVFEKYNPNISAEELRVFVWHKEKIAQPLSTKWKDLCTAEDQIYPELADENEITEWVKKGLLYYFKGDLVPAYLYLAENIYDKVTRLVPAKDDSANSGQDKEHIIKTYGQSVYDNQLSKLNEVYSNVYGNRLLIKSASADDGLVILPTSKLADQFMIKTLIDEIPFKSKIITASKDKNYGKPDLLKTGFVSERDKKEINELSLKLAFCYWLVNYAGEIEFKRGTNYNEIIRVYINNAPRPRKQEGIAEKDHIAAWERTKARTKSEGDRLFKVFLDTMLTMNDKARLETEWNRSFNGYVPIDYTKVPIAFECAKMFRGEAFDIKEEKREAVSFIFSEGSGCLAYGVGLGKGNLLTSDILTPNGYVKMGTLKVGDKVIGKNGKETNVIGVFPLGKVQCYKVTFSDGSYTEVSDEHLWNVQDIHDRYENGGVKWRTLMTKDIKDNLYNYRGDYRYSIPMVEPVEFEEKELPLHPYLLGVLLGDGSLSQNRVGFSNSENDVREKIQKLLPDSVELRGGLDGKDWRISRKSISGENEVLRIIKELNLQGTYSNTKFIPEIYKINSAENRLELLRGLLDTDGYIMLSKQGKKGCFLQYTTVSKQLRDDIIFLVQSFGGTCVTREKLPKFTHNGEKKTGQLAYNITIRLPKGIMPVSSIKQTSKFVEKTKYQPIRFIQSIEDIGLQEAQCIKVDAQDELYVCDNFIVTHNTISAIFTIEQFIEAGYCSRPFLVVPNQTYKQWLSEIKNAMPQRRINDLYNLRGEYYEQQLDENGNVMKVDAGSISVMTYEGFEMMGFNEVTQEKIFNSLYDILNQGGEDERMSEAAAEKKAAGFREKLLTLIGRGAKGGIVNIEDIGFDFACYDEAHAMKKVFTVVKGEQTEEGSRERTQYKIQSGSPSGTALKGFMMSQYILQNNNYRNVLLLTATPFTNSPLEIFSMLALVAYKKLSDTDLNNITAFFDNYISCTTELTINAKMRPQYKQVVKGYHNLPALQQLIFRFFNYKETTKDLVRPNKIVLPLSKKIENGITIKLSENEKIDTFVPMTAAQSDMMDRIKLYAEQKISEDELIGNVSTGVQVSADVDDDAATDAEAAVLDFSSLDKEEKAGVIMLKAMNHARNLALSPYLYEWSGLGKPDYLSYIEQSPKLKYVMECIRSVKQYHESKNEPVSGQIIYMDRGIEYFHLIREYLIKEVGYKPHEVGAIYSQMAGGKDAKENAKNAFLGIKYDPKIKDTVAIPDSERMKVVIGSSTIKEGLNLQRKTTVLYDCFLDWNPTDFVQLCGRCWRQGNEFENVRIVLPLVIDSIDIFMFQKLEEKTERVNTIWASDLGKSVLPLDEMNPAELKYALIKDVNVLAELQLIDEKSKVDDAISNEKNNIRRLQSIKKYIATIKYKTEDLRKEVAEVRPSKAKKDIDGLITEFQDIIRKQTDDEGKKMVYSWKRNQMTFAEKVKQNISDKNEVSKPYWFDELNLSNRNLKRERRDFLIPKGIPESDIDYFISTYEASVENLEKEAKRLTSDELIKIKADEIQAEREANQVSFKNIPQLVNEFGRLNNLLSIKRSAKQIKKQEAEIWCEIRDDKGEIRIDEEAIEQLEKCIEDAPSTKSMHTDINGNYTEERKRFHEKIIADLRINKACIQNDAPIAILTGGAPGSGKSTFLKKYAPYLLSEEIYKIDADEIRAKFPEYKGWNSKQTHEEAKDIVNTLLSEGNIGRPCKFDIIWDGTMNSTKNYLPLIGMLRKLGYRIFIIYMNNIPYAEILKRTRERYKRGAEGGFHRYVPKAVIDDFFTKGKTALNELKEKVDGYVVVDGSTFDYKIIEKGGIDLPANREYSKLTTSDGLSADMNAKPVDKRKTLELRVKFLKREKNPSKTILMRIKFIEKGLASGNFAKGGRVDLPKVSELESKGEKLDDYFGALNYTEIYKYNDQYYAVEYPLLRKNGTAYNEEKAVVVKFDGKANGYAKGGRIEWDGFLSYKDDKLGYSFLKEKGYNIDSDLNYSVEETGIDFYIGIKGKEAAIAVIDNPEKDDVFQNITKNDLLEMSKTANWKNITKIVLYTNHGIDIHSIENPKNYGIDKIIKVGSKFLKGGKVEDMTDQEAIDEANNILYYEMMDYGEDEITDPEIARNFLTEYYSD